MGHGAPSFMLKIVAKECYREIDVEELVCRQKSNNQHPITQERGFNGLTLNLNASLLL